MYLEFHFENHGAMQFGLNDKLGHSIYWRATDVAYILALPPLLSGVHDAFDILVLKEC